MDLWADLAELRRRQSEKWRMYPEDVLPVWVAEMDVVLAEPIRAALADALANSDTGYAFPGSLPQAYADFAERRFGWRPDPAAIKLMPDVARAVRCAIELTTSRGDAVVINPPVYPPFYEWLEMTGRRLVTSPLVDGRLDLDGLAAAFAQGARAYLLCSPQNPTGTVHTRAELESVAALAGRYGVSVIVDEIHAPLTLGGVAFTPYLSIVDDAFVAVSTSKAWNLAGLKAALLVAGASVAPALPRIETDAATSAGIFGVSASLAALTAGDAWLDALVAALETNRNWLTKALEPLGIGYQPPEATYLAWLDFRSLGLGDDPAAVLLGRGRVGLTAGHRFGPEGNGFARLNFATRPEVLEEAVGRIASGLK